METVLVLGALGCGALWLARKWIAHAREAAVPQGREADRQRVLTEQRRRSAETQRKRREQLRMLNLLARNLQLALFQLKQAPDFRRAATFAAMAKAIPLAFRQRQFRRFKGRMVAHMVDRLAAGADPETLTQSLGSLLQSLGVAPYEAEYIRAEAERRATAPRSLPPPPPYAHRLAQIQRDHEQRVTGLQSLTGLDPDMLEQLLELEETRFRQALQNLGNDDTVECQVPERGPR